MNEMAWFLKCGGKLIMFSPAHRRKLNADKMPRPLQKHLSAISSSSSSTKIGFKESILSYVLNILIFVVNHEF